jgi:hypothetical protein
MDTDAATDKYLPIALTRSPLHRNIISIPLILDMYVALWKESPYHYDTKIFQPHWINKEVLGRHGGVSCQCCQFLFDKPIFQLIAWAVLDRSHPVMERMVLKDPDFPSFTEIEAFIKRYKHEFAAKTSKKKLKEVTEYAYELDARLVVGTKADWTFFSSELLTGINDVFKETLALEREAIGTMEDGYRTQMVAYVAGSLAQMDERATSHPLLDVAKAKYTWMMFSRDGGAPLWPIMTEAAVEAAVYAFSLTPLAFDEVRLYITDFHACVPHYLSLIIIVQMTSWFDGLHGYQATTRGEGRTIDALSTIAAALRVDRHVKNKKPAILKVILLPINLMQI